MDIHQPATDQSQGPDRVGVCVHRVGFEFTIMPDGSFHTLLQKYFQRRVLPLLWRFALENDLYRRVAVCSVIFRGELGGEPRSFPGAVVARHAALIEYVRVFDHETAVREKEAGRPAPPTRTVMIRLAARQLANEDRVRVLFQIAD